MQKLVKALWLLGLQAASRIFSLNPEIVISQVFPDMQAIYQLRELVPMKHPESVNP